MLKSARRRDKEYLISFRESELNATHTRYDRIIAGGPDLERWRSWVSYSTIAVTVAAFIFVVLVAILRKPKVRSRPSNLFLIFLMIPDLMFSLLCGINCALNATRGHFVSESWCKFQVFYCIWGIGTNAWLNGLIAGHIHYMLKCGQLRQHYVLPSQRQVILQCSTVYAFMAILATFPSIDFLPIEPRFSNGIACLPREYDRASTLFQWLVFVPLFALIPTGYVLYVTWDILHKKLLSQIIKRRELSLFFFRIVLVFLVMWIPSMFLLFVAGGPFPASAAVVGGSWSHLQGAVSTTASVMKRDIRQAVLEFITFGRYTGKQQPQHDRALPGSTTGVGRTSTHARGKEDTTCSGKEGTGQEDLPASHSGVLSEIGFGTSTTLDRVDDEER